MKSLIAFSSGYDSLYIAWRYLTETNNDVTLFFMDMSLLQKQEEVESYINPFQKYTSLISHKWMKENLRDHEFKTHFIEEMDHRYDHAKTFCKLAANWMNEGLYDEAVHSASAIYNNFGLTVTRNAVMQKEFDSITKRGSLTFPLLNWKKHTADQIVELPKEMQHLAISCNFATTDDEGNFVECGSCHKCYRNIMIKRALRNGRSADEAMKIYNNDLEAQRTVKIFHDTKDSWGYFDEVK